MIRLITILFSFAALIVMLLSSGCDDYSHTSVVNTPPINYVTLTNMTSFGGPDYDWGTSIVADGDDGYLIAGATTSWGYGTNTMYLARTDRTGGVVWFNWLGGWGNDIGQAVGLSPDSSVIVAGVTKSFYLRTGIKIDPNSGMPLDDYNFYLAKTDLDGATLWEKPFGDSLNIEWATSLVVLEDGYFVAGYQAQEDLQEDLFFLRTDLDGNLVYQMPYGTSDMDRAFSAAETQDGGFVMAGFTKMTSPTDRSPYIVKVDGTGTVLWEKIHGDTSYNETVYSIIETANGDLVGVGIASPRSTPDPLADRLYAVRTNSTGNIVWENVYSQAGVSEGRYVVEDQEGSLMICGQNPNRETVMMTKLTGDGSFLWSDSTHARGFGLGMVPGGSGYVITGSTSYPDHRELNNVLFIEIAEDQTNLE